MNFILWARLFVRRLFGRIGCNIYGYRTLESASFIYRSRSRSVRHCLGGLAGRHSDKRTKSCNDDKRNIETQCNLININFGYHDKSMGKMSKYSATHKYIYISLCVY